MFIRCWGSRGSIAVSGKQFVKYGGDTTCMEIRSKDGKLIIIDAGTGIRCLGNTIDTRKDKSMTMLFTHAHLDHVMGFPFFVPLFHRGVTITVRGYPYEMRSYRDILSGILRCPYFPVSLDDPDIKARLIFRNIPTKSFSIGSITVYPIPLNHPKNGGTGFRFEEDGKSFVFLTDNELDFSHNGGLRFNDYAGFAQDADLLIHDGEYDKKDYKHTRGWGHSLYSDAVKLGLQANVKQLGLFHLNNCRSDDQVDRMVGASQKIIDRAHSSMKVSAVGTGFSITL